MHIESMVYTKSKSSTRAHAFYLSCIYMVYDRNLISVFNGQLPSSFIFIVTAFAVP